MTKELRHENSNPSYDYAPWILEENVACMASVVAISKQRNPNRQMQYSRCPDGEKRERVPLVENRGSEVLLRTSMESVNRNRTPRFRGKVNHVGRIGNRK